MTVPDHIAIIVHDVLKILDRLMSHFSIIFLTLPATELTLFSSSQPEKRVSPVSAIPGDQAGPSTLSAAEPEIALEDNAEPLARRVALFLVHELVLDVQPTVVHGR